METGHPSTRAVNSGSGNRALETTRMYPCGTLCVFVCVTFRKAAGLLN